MYNLRETYAKGGIIFCIFLRPVVMFSRRLQNEISSNKKLFKQFSVDIGSGLSLLATTWKPNKAISYINLLHMYCNVPLWC